MIAAPLPLVDGGPGTGLLTAFGIGIAFGASLERAGLGSARKLAAQFYLTDFAVFKVMFTAIVTAMLGVFILSGLGLLDRSRLLVPETFLLPQVVGGAIFGVGFVMGGYCPGTSCVGAVTGRIDALVLWVGMALGMFLFGEAFPRLQDFYEMTSRGALTLPDWFHLPYGIVVAGVALLASAGFALAGRLEDTEASQADEKPEG